MKRLVLAVMAMVAIGLVVTSGPAMAAGTVADTFVVTAAVQSSCNITTAASDIDVSATPYDPLSATPLTGNGTISFRCTRGTTYWTYIPEYPAASGAWQLSDGTDSLNILLCKDAACATQYDMSLTGAGTLSANNAPQNVTYYLEIPVNQFVGVGTYSGSFDYTIEW